MSGRGRGKRRAGGTNARGGGETNVAPLSPSDNLRPFLYPLPTNAPPHPSGHDKDYKVFITKAQICLSDSYRNRFIESPTLLSTIRDTIQADDVLFCRLSASAPYYATPANQESLGETGFQVPAIWLQQHLISHLDAASERAAFFTVQVSSLAPSVLGSYQSWRGSNIKSHLREVKERRNFRQSPKFTLTSTNWSRFAVRFGICCRLGMSFRRVG